MLTLVMKAKEPTHIRVEPKVYRILSKLKVAERETLSQVIERIIDEYDIAKTLKDAKLK